MAIFSLLKKVLLVLWPVEGQLGNLANCMDEMNTTVPVVDLAQLNESSLVQPD